MRRVVASLVPLLTAAFLLGGCASMSPDAAGWETLIDGPRGLDNWIPVGDANWRVEDGAIVADKGKGGFLMTKKSYRDFQVRAEFWAAPNANSGIYMRCSDPKNLTDRNCYEANVFDQRPDPTYGTGAIVHRAPVPPNAYKTANQWNTFDITVKGDEITVVLNGVQTARVRNDELKEGPVALQYGTLPPKGEPGGLIKFRKVQIRAL